MRKGPLANDFQPLGEHFGQRQVQKVAKDKAWGKLGVVAVEILYTLAIHLGTPSLYIIPLQEELGEHARTTAHLQHITLGAHSLGNASGHAHIGQKVLSEGLFGPHIVWVVRGCR